MTVGRWVIWTPGLAVAIGAAVATAHGLYEVAVAAAVPPAIAWLYPLITDGLALVAYAATARLHARAARYAWSVVVLAAGLSGLAQAAYLAAGVAGAGAPVVAAPAVLRFGIGAWPAVAAAIVAHLLYLLATDATTGAEPLAAPSEPDLCLVALDGTAGAGLPRAVTPAPALTTDDPKGDDGPPQGHAVQAGLSTAPAVQSDPAAVQPSTAPAVQSCPWPGVPDPASSLRAVAAAVSAEQPDRRAGASPARDRARAAAVRHAAGHGDLPTVSELEAAAEVSRGTAAAVLKHLRDHPTPLHLITAADSRGEHADEPTIEEHNQP